MGNIDHIKYLTGQALNGLLVANFQDNVEEIAVQMAIKTEELLAIHKAEKRAQREKSNDH